VQTVWESVTTEADILRAIRLALGNEPDIVLWRLGSGVMKTPAGRVVRLGLNINGAADLIGILAPGGRWFALEVKCRGRLSREQRQWLALVQSMGGFATCIREHVPAAAADAAHAALARARAGESE